MLIVYARVCDEPYMQAIDIKDVVAFNFLLEGPEPKRRGLAQLSLVEGGKRTRSPEACANSR
jgi:hypothetical protein